MQVYPKERFLFLLDFFDLFGRGFCRDYCLCAGFPFHGNVLFVANLFLCVSCFVPLSCMRCPRITCFMPCTIYVNPILGLSDFCVQPVTQSEPFGFLSVVLWQHLRGWGPFRGEAPHRAAGAAAESPSHGGEIPDGVPVASRPKALPHGSPTASAGRSHCIRAAGAYRVAMTSLIFAR